jgi:hypothetical protein
MKHIRSMPKGWKFEVLRERLDGRPSVMAFYMVALSDQKGAIARLRSQEGFSDESIEVIGEVDQALLDRWGVEAGEVICIVAWS